MGRRLPALAGVREECRRNGGGKLSRGSFDGRQWLRRTLKLYSFSDLGFSEIDEVLLQVCRRRSRGRGVERARPSSGGPRPRACRKR